jgi:hypothetical protein
MKGRRKSEYTIPLQIGIMSYNNRVYITVYTDAENKGMAKGVTDRFVLEFHKLLENAKLSSEGKGDGETNERKGKYS